MATTGSATALGMGDRVGRLSPGYEADLLAVHGDPTVDLSALHRPRLVLARGNPVDGVGDTTAASDVDPHESPAPTSD